MELDNGVEGLVHITTLKDDYYEYLESQYALVGTHHKRRYQLGDKVEVLLARADLEARSLDFLIKDNCDTAALNMENSQDRKNKAGAKDAGQEEKSRRKPRAVRSAREIRLAKRRKTKNPSWRLRRASGQKEPKTSPEREKTKG